MHIGKRLLLINTTLNHLKITVIHIAAVKQISFQIVCNIIVNAFTVLHINEPNTNTKNVIQVSSNNTTSHVFFGSPVLLPGTVSKSSKNFSCLIEYIV